MDCLFDGFGTCNRKREVRDDTKLEVKQIISEISSQYNIL